MTEVADNTIVDGRYRIKHRIGSGGMADVYCAEDTHLGREVALKVLHRRFAQDQEFVERFRREAASAAGLQHPNVVGVFDRGEHDGTYYIAMEHLPGRTLKDILADEAPLPQERAIDLAMQILQAAGFAHRRGVIHRDFKPHNVIVDDDGNAKVTDFGIARRGASEMTETGSIMGTAQYLSPEQAQGHAVTASSDLYSIGVMLYEMLTGRLPFEGESAVSIALKHLSEPPLPPSQLRPDLDPALEAVVMGALAKEPEHRWQSAEDFAAALEGGPRPGRGGRRRRAGHGGVRARAGGAVAGRPTYGAPPDSDPRRKRHRRRRWPFTGAVPRWSSGWSRWCTRSRGPRRSTCRAWRARPCSRRATSSSAGASTRSRSSGCAASPSATRCSTRTPTPASRPRRTTRSRSRCRTAPARPSSRPCRNLPREQAVKDLNQAGFKVERRHGAVGHGRGGLRHPDRAEGGHARGPRPARDAVRLERPGARHGAGRGRAVSRLGRGALTSEGLDVAIQEEESDEPEDEVIAQDPDGGSRIERGRDGDDHRLDGPRAGGRAERDRSLRCGRDRHPAPGGTGRAPARARGDRPEPRTGSWSSSDRRRGSRSTRAAG